MCNNALQEVAFYSSNIFIRSNSKIAVMKHDMFVNSKRYIQLTYVERVKSTKLSQQRKYAYK